MSREKNLLYLWRLLVDYKEEVWKKWHRRTTYSFKELGIPLTSLTIEHELFFDEKEFKKIFAEKGKFQLSRFFDGSMVEIPLLSLPKENLLLDESIKVNGERGFRTNRVQGSKNVADILFSLYPSAGDKEKDRIVYRIIRSMAAYAPAEQCKREFFQSICRNYNHKEKARQIQNWLAPRLEPYIDITSPVFGKIFSDGNDLFMEVISKMEQLCGKWSEESPATNVALNPLLAIQDYVSLYEVNPDNSYLEAVKFLIETHLKWQGASTDLKERLLTMIRFQGDLFWAFVKVPLSFNQEILVSHSQKIPIEDSRMYPFTFKLADTQSLHVDFQLPSNVMQFRTKPRKTIEAKRYLKGEKPEWLKIRDPIKVFGRIHMSSKVKHFYTTKDKLKVYDRNKTYLGETQTIKIKLQQRLNTVTTISLLVILFSVFVLAGATIVTGNPALWGSLALASTLLVSFSSLPREDPAFVRRAKWWLIFIGVFLFIGLVCGFVSMLDNLFPWLSPWPSIGNFFLGIIGL